MHDTVLTPKSGFVYVLVTLQHLALTSVSRRAMS